MKKLSSLSVVYPVFNDSYSLSQLIKKTVGFLPFVANEYEIIIVNDGSDDKTTKILLSEFEEKIPFLSVINHKKNLGYGAALATGFAKAKSDFIFYTDSDGQYDPLELKKLVAKFNDKVDLVTGFKLNRADTWFRRIIGFLYNHFVKILFNLNVRDVDCDFRLFRRSLLQGLNFKIASGAFDVDFMKKLQQKKVRFREVPVHHYKRQYGKSQFFSFLNIARSLFDLTKI
ncbi:MAG: glycosyltransferase family 2 protein [Patescibacteria group bacterium]|nr:glycosyltransferase family 2 protein [Patescibacteria group bacterium]MCL5095391.1 glycosyltransferase family 2 protein [Patescibacteria group bacterium]